MQAPLSRARSDSPHGGPAARLWSASLPHRPPSAELGAVSQPRTAPLSVESGLEGDREQQTVCSPSRVGADKCLKPRPPVGLQQRGRGSQFGGQTHDPGEEGKHSQRGHGFGFLTKRPSCPERLNEPSRGLPCWGSQKPLALRPSARPSLSFRRRPRSRLLPGGEPEPPPGLRLEGGRL